VTDSLPACIRRKWDPYRRAPYLTLQGTGTVLDGTVMATHFDRRPYPEQVKANLSTLNARRLALRLPTIRRIPNGP
jgi:hypothetical protein